MDPIQILKSQAREKRDKTIRYARLEYRQTAREIAIIARRMSDGPDHRRKYQVVRRSADGPLSAMTAIGAAESVLRELGPLTLVELTLAVMERGCRAGDEPRAVAHAIRGSLVYHTDRFSRDSVGRWASNG